MKKLLCTLMATLAFSTQAKINNQSYTFIGFGVGEVSYLEGGTLSSGITFETNPTTTNIFNYSGAYTATGERFGFYINTANTLDSTSEDEFWRASGTVSNGDVSHSVDGVYQTNITSSAHNELDMLLSFLFAPGHQLVTGLSYSRTLMDRNGFENGPQLDNFNMAHLTPAIGNTDFPDGATDSNNNGVLELDELIATYGVNPKATIVNFTETFTTVVAQLGYIYDSRFASEELGLRLVAGAMIGTPLYYDVVNTSRAQLSFSDSFNGYNLKTYIGAGWSFTEKYGLLATFNYYYQERDEVKVDIGRSDELDRNRSAKIPDNELDYWNLSLSAYWNF